MTFDPHKDITITYNFLNLPSQINKTGAGGGTISLTYDAAGRKWRKQVTGVTKDYCQGIEYKDGKVEAVYGQEGRLTAVYDQYGVTLTRFRAEYWLKDHLGNTRLAFADENHNGTIEVWDDPSTPENEAEIVQAQRSGVPYRRKEVGKNHYYPFGMNQEGPWYATIGPINGYQYNGKELNEELDLDWNDFGARWQDPATGRWWQVDPLADRYVNISSYVYTANNPILLIDPFGRDIIVGSQIWTPGAKWEGDEGDFGYQVFSVLNTLAESGVSEFAFSTTDGTNYAGDALLDFVEGGKFENIHITIVEGEKTEALGGGIISFNLTTGIMVHNPAEDNSIAPNLLLLHEFGHEWQKSNFGIENYLNPLLEDHELSIINNLEAPAAIKLGMGVRETHVTFESQEQAIEKLRIGPNFQRTQYEKNRAKNTPYNYFIQTIGPNSKAPKNK
jgi:RHS repeat-associated protein